MNKTHTKKYISFIAAIYFVCVFFFVPKKVEAAVLLPGNISTCGELAVPGTYTLTQNITGGADTCFLVSSDNVVIEGGGFTVTGTAATAIDGRAYTSGALTAGANAYTNLIVNDLTLSGYGTGINLSGNADNSGNGVNNGYGGDAGDVAIFYSYVGGITLNGGNSSSQSYGGLGGNIAFTDTNLNISNSAISALGGMGTTGRNTNGGLDLNYSGTLNKSDLLLSALSFLNDNATSYGVYFGGSFPIAPGNIDTCGTLLGSGTYTLTQDLVSTSTCFVIGSNNIVINGNGHSVTAATTTSSFAINANTVSDFTLASTTVNTFANLITSNSSVTISGHDLDLSNKYIAAGSLTLNYTGTLNKSGATISSLFSGLTVNGISYGVQNAGALLEWVARDSNRDWRSIASSADGTKLAAVVQGGKIYTSTDSGATWTARDSNRSWQSIASSADGTKLAATVNGGQIYTSADSGVTWTARLTDENRYWKGIASSADGAKLAAVMGDGQIYTSADSGVTWTARLTDSNRYWTGIASSADGTKLAAVVQGGKIYTSTDSGATWTARDSNRDWRSIASSADGTKLVTVVSNGQIYTSTDSGATWTARDSNRSWQSIASSADGTKLAAAVQSNRIYIYQDDFPQLKVDTLSPQSLSNSFAWQPIVSWGTAASCYYSFDNFVSTSTANCASLGSDISSPGYGSKTLYVKGIDANGIVVQKNVSFTLSLPITITAPTSGQTVTSWAPVINWDPLSSGTVANCYYSYDNFVSTSTASCGLAGTDIVPPSSSGTKILYLKKLDSNGNIGNNNVIFMYNPPWIARDSNRNWSSIASSADGAKLVATVNGGQIYTSSNSGTTWIARDSNRNWRSIASSADGAKLVSVVSNGQIYTSTDSGTTWIARDSNRNWSSIASSADGAKLVATVNGGQIYTSSNSGTTWIARDSNRNWISVTSSADGAKLVSVVSNGQIYTSTDSGVTWTARLTDSNRYWNSIASSADGTKLAATVNGGQIYTSADSGVTWTARLTDSNRYWNSIASSADGTKLIAGGQNMPIFYSDDSGVTWTQKDSVRYWTSMAMSTDGNKMVAVISNGLIYTYDSNASISIIRPVALTSVLARAWSALVLWGSSVSCYYSFDNFVSTSTANCASLGSDIAYPSTVGTNTLTVKGINSVGSTTIQSVDFEFETWSAKESDRPWSSIASSADGTKLVATVNGGQIYTSSNSGASWTARDSNRAWLSVASSADGTKMAAVVQGGQIYTSTDSGTTWTARESNRDWWGIASSADGTKLAATVSSGTSIYKSTDSGVTWTAQTVPMAFGYILSSSDGTKLAAITPVRHFSQVNASGGRLYFSTDSGATWVNRGTTNTFWYSIAMSSDASKFYAVVGDGSGQVYSSTDFGVTLTPRAGVRSWDWITASADGTKVFASVQNGKNYVSTDSGVTWVARDNFNKYKSMIYVSPDGSKLTSLVYNGKIYVSASLPAVLSPTSSSTVTYWSPTVDWSRSLTCQYSYDNSTWSGVSCNNAGSDIPAPSASGLTTLYLKGTDFQSVVSTSSVSFAYFATQSGNSISSCGNISTSGTYTLTQNITGVTGRCFVVSADNVTINGAGFTVTASPGNASYAVTSGSYTGLSFQNIRFMGFQGIVASNADVTYSGTDVDLTNSTTSVMSLIVSYTNSLTALNTYFQNVQSLIINSIELGGFPQGLFSWNQQDISTCQTLSTPGNYKITADITNVSGTCFTITSDKVVIDGDGHTVSGTGGNTGFAIVATSTNANVYTGISVKNLTLTGFDGGVDARGAAGDALSVMGGGGSNVTLYNVHFPTDKVAINASGGNSFYQGPLVPAVDGGGGGYITVKNSTVGSFILNGGNALGDTNPGQYNGFASGGYRGSVNAFNSTIGNIISNNGLDYSPGCMNNNFDNYNQSATYDDGTCTNVAVGLYRDNPQGHTENGPIDFYYYSNHGIVNGNANFYDVDVYYNNGGGGYNYGTTTGHAVFDNNWSNSDAYNYGYVGGGADFHDYTYNYGTVDGTTTFQYGSNFGTINGSADFTSGGGFESFNYGLVNGDAIFYSGDDNYGYYNYGIVTGNITYLYGCTDPAASNYVIAENDNGSCVYYGSSSDVPSGVTVNGPVYFQDGYSNYGTIQGNATFGYGSYNYGTVTGNASFAEIVGGTGGDSSVLQLDLDYFFNGNTYVGTGFVGGSVYDTNNHIITTIIFDGVANYEGNAVTSAPHVIMRNGAHNYGTIKGNQIHFYDAVNSGVAQGTVHFNGSNASNSGEFASVVGDAYFENYSSNAALVTGDAHFALSGGSAYSSETPPPGTMYLADHDWAGEVTGTVYGSDNNQITEYVFYNTLRNTAAINGNARFNDSSYNYATITGNAVLNTDHYGAVPTTSTLTLTNNWFGDITGSVFASDGVTEITNFVFNGSATNLGIVRATATFNALSSNSGTVNGDATFTGATFRIGTVNGAATLSGFAQTLQGVSNVVNFFKRALSRDTLYFEQGSTLNVSGLATILGADGGNLLTLRSNSPGSYANLNIAGTSNMDNLRIRDIHNSGLSQDLSAKTAFDDGGNTGFSFRSNTTPSSRGGVTTTYAPSLPVSRGGTPPPTPVVSTPAPVNAAAAGGRPSGTIDSFFTETIKPIVFKPTTKFDVIKTDGKNAGTTYIPNPLKNFAVNSALELTKLPTNFLGNLSKFFSATSNNFKGYPEFASYLAGKGINVTKPKDIAVLGNKPIRIKSTDTIDVPGVFSLNIASDITYGNSTGAIIQLAKVQGGKNVIISLLNDQKVIGTYAGQNIAFNQNGNMQTLNITAPTKPGIYTLKASASPIPLVLQVVEASKAVPIEEVKKNGIINWIKNLFN